MIENSSGILSSRIVLDEESTPIGDEVTPTKKKRYAAAATNQTRTTAMRKRATAAAIGSCAVALAALGVWWLGVASDESPAPHEGLVAEPPSTNADADQEATLAQLSQQNVARQPPPAPQAPPTFEVRDRPAPVPTPPAGYAFAGGNDSMTKAYTTVFDVEPLGDPAAKFDWLVEGAGVAGLVDQARAAGRDWTYGWVGVAGDADVDLVVLELQRLGAVVLGRARSLLRAQLPGDPARLEAIAALPAVAGVAPTPVALKMHPALVRQAATQSVSSRIPTLVTLMADDADGRWRRALLALGAEVGAFDSTIRVYPANVPHGALHALAAMDFVLAVEPARLIEAAHDTAVPAMGADALRTYADAASAFSGLGGAAVPVGVMDTGLNINHVAIANDRSSVCGANFVSQAFGSGGRDEDRDLWVDWGGHGTHVTGTILGNAAVRPLLAGMAPRVQHVRFAKVLSTYGFGSSMSVARGMDFLAEATACGAPDTPPRKPLIVNMSLGADAVAWDGKSADERKLDAVVWAHRQLYVVAQANSGYLRYGNFASAKNSLAVGAIHDRGDIAAFSSFGPTGDGRLAPQVVATGVDLASARGNGSRKGYAVLSGTSMATPAVSGVAALLMEAVPELREQPAAVRARLMASAIKPDALLADAAQFPLHNSGGPGAVQARYGMGKVSARAAVLDRDDEAGWLSGSAVVELADGEYGYRDIVVPAGASRLDIVMTWDERPADTFAGTMLNDLDLWVDRDADCTGAQTAACGEAASRSTKDNVEWVIVRDPAPGTYRLKVVPKFSRVEAPRAAVAWTVIRGPSTPQLAVEASADAVSVAAGQAFEIEATVTADGYVAAGTMLRLDCRGERGSTACERLDLVSASASTVDREDGLTRSLSGESGAAIALGEVAGGEQQRVKLAFEGMTTDRFRLFLTVWAWNGRAASTSVDVHVGTPDIAVAGAADIPANDDFAAATRLASPAGEATFDLLLATPEPGEPPFAAGLVDEYGYFQNTARPRSVWYRFTAPADDTYRFTIVKSGPDDIADDVQLDLFEAEDDAALIALSTAAAKTGGGLTFVAARNNVYYLRLSISEDRLVVRTEEFFGATEPIARRQARPLTLRWGTGPRPANDDFAAAAPLAGTAGDWRGNNQGATLEAGEFLGGMAATTWHRWRAPPAVDGEMRFTVDRRYLNVAVFTGSAVSDLRLVSGEPGPAATLPVQAGADYLIAVAADDAGTSGTDYTLAWESVERLETGNDHVADAEALASEEASEHRTEVDFANATVEPFEPVESGSRTVWFAWNAPASGRYAWRLSAGGDGTQLAAFEPGAVAAVGPGQPRMSLTPLAVSEVDRHSDILLAFDAMAGLDYRLAAGIAPQSAFQELGLSSLGLTWGPVPDNDRFATAGAIAGASGTVTGTTDNATLEPGEFVAGLGDASVWWQWQAPTSQWFRFSLSGAASTNVVAVFEIRGASIHDLVLVATSRRLDDDVAVFKATAGTRYAIRVGRTAEGGLVFDDDPSGAVDDGSPVEDDAVDTFTLAWDENGAPAWLAFVAAVADGDLDADGEFLNLDGANGVALNGAGSELYLASSLGLQVYARDAVSGELAFVQQLGGADGDSLLFWDAATASLIGGGCSGWYRYPVADDGPGLAQPVEIGGASPCASELFRDADGDFLYFVRRSWGIDVYRLDAARSTIELVEMKAVEGLQTAAIGVDGRYVYVPTTARGLEIYTRGAFTGRLAFVGAVAADDVTDAGDDSDDGSGMDLSLLEALAVDASGRYLLGIDPLANVAALDLSDPDAPTLIGWQRSFVPSGFWFWWSPGVGEFPVGGGQEQRTCFFADIRGSTLSADVFCVDSAFAIRLMPEAMTLRPEDYLISEGVDVFGNDVPWFHLDRGLAASPDGRHLYAVEANRLLIFERSTGKAGDD